MNTIKLEDKNNGVINVRRIIGTLNIIAGQ